MEEKQGLPMEEARPEGAQATDAAPEEAGLPPEVERRIELELERARGAWAEETKQAVERARAEAEALARMSSRERAEHEFAQRQSQLDARERAILGRELRADAARMLQERGLPEELIGAVDVLSAERVQQSMDAVERAFRSAVQRGVEARMRGGAPAAGRREAATQESDEDYYRARYASGQIDRQGG